MHERRAENMRQCLILPPSSSLLPASPGKSACASCVNSKGRRRVLLSLRDALTTMDVLPMQVCWKKAPDEHTVHCQERWSSKSKNVCVCSSEQEAPQHATAYSGSSPASSSFPACMLPKMPAGGDPPPPPSLPAAKE